MKNLFRNNTRLLLCCALIPPSLYANLLNRQPIPYSPLVDYSLMHFPFYEKEVAKSETDAVAVEESLRQGLQRLEADLSAQTGGSGKMENPAPTP